MVRALMIRNTELLEKIKSINSSNISVNGKEVSLEELSLIRIKPMHKTEINTLSELINNVRRVFGDIGISIEVQIKEYSESEITELKNMNVAILGIVDTSEIAELEQMIVSISSRNEVFKWVITDNEYKADLNTIRIIEDEFKKKLKQKVGICDITFSPTFEGCITACDARDIIAKTCNSDDKLLPTSNHEKGNIDSCNNYCNCFRYEVIDSIEEIIKAVENNEKKVKGNNSNNNRKKAPEIKRVFQFDRFSL